MTSLASIWIYLNCHCGWTYRGRGMFLASQAFHHHQDNCPGKPNDDLPATA